MVLRSSPFILLLSLLTLMACHQQQEAKTVEQKENTKKVSIQEIEAGIKDFIQQEAAKKNGYFEVNDRGKDYRMKLVRVNTEYISNLGAKSYFACVDLADEKGDVYDVDFFLEGDPGAMHVTATSVHKLNGKPFYAWKQQKDKTWNRIPVKEANTRLLGVIEGSDAFEFHYQVELPEIRGEAKVWIPIATSDAYQTVEISSLVVPGEYRLLKDAEFNNTILYLEPKAINSKQLLTITYQVKRMEKGPVEETGPVDKRYLEENLLMPVGGRFTDIAKEAMKGREEASLMKARALYDYIIDNMRYMKYGTFGTGDANYACDLKTGNCTEFHSFFISLARSSGIPARFAVGASIPSERNEGGIDGYHCWAEFYAEGKWWPIDISEANKYTALATYYFGHHPANRIEFSRGRDLLVQPAPASGPINFLAYPLVEINEREVTAKTTFSFKRSATPAL